MARNNTRGKRRVKKNIAKGVAHVHSTFNNTIVTLCDKEGNTISWASAGTLQNPHPHVWNHLRAAYHDPPATGSTPSQGLWK